MATGTPSGRSTELPDPVVADLLGDETRRRALELLVERDEALAVGDLAAEILADRRDADPAEIPKRDRRALRDELFETHLPKLTATGVVDYDSMVGTVELETESILTRVEE